MNRVSEVAAKLGRLLKVLERTGAGALRLRGSEWFFWATAGGSNVVLLALETGVAELVVTKNGAYVLCDNIEAQRLRDEEIVGPLEVRDSPWADSAAREKLARELIGGGHVLSDRPQAGEDPLPPGTELLRWTLLEAEQERYRAVGRTAAEAMTAAMQKAEPDWTEARLAAEGARALRERGLEPALILAAGRRRLGLYRHFTVKDELLNGYAAMVFCARGGGLYANLTRFLSFGPPDDVHRERHAQVREVEGKLWAASQPGARLDDLYEVARRAYAEVGEPGEILQHHQGGPTGYLSRERVATPATHDVLGPGMALAWNPSVTGAKIEDTVLIGAAGVSEVLTLDPAWPTVSTGHGERPAVLEL